MTYMTNKKFTDEEVIKALELCSKSLSIKTCQKCPFYLQTNCVSALKLNAIDLINRQKAEIEKLQEEFLLIFEKMESEYDAKIKAEACKEFADKLKEKRWNAECRVGYVQVVDVGDIDEVLKEMVGEEE